MPVSTAELSWRVLGFVNGLRLLASSALATLFVSIMPDSVGRLDPALFAGAATAYFLYAVISIGSIKRRAPDIVLQTWTGVFADVLVLSLLTYASGGVNDGIAALVTLSVGATSFILRRRLAMQIAAAASFAMLIQPGITLLADTDAVGDFASAAITGALTIIIGLGISQLARVLRQNEEIVRLREIDTSDITDLYRSVAQHLREGVLVVDGDNRITIISDPAATLLMGGEVIAGSTLDEVSPRLANLLDSWRSYFCDESRSAPVMLALDGEKRLQLKFVSLDSSIQGPALVFVEDKARVAAPVWSTESGPSPLEVKRAPAKAAAKAAAPREREPVPAVVARPVPAVRAVPAVRPVPAARPLPALREVAVSEPEYASAAQGRSFEPAYAASAPRERSFESPYAAGAPRERQREPAYAPIPALEESAFGLGLSGVSALRPSEPKQDPFRPAEPFRENVRRQSPPRELPRAELPRPEAPRPEAPRAEPPSSDTSRSGSYRAEVLRENLERQNSLRAALQEASPWENAQPQRPAPAVAPAVPAAAAPPAAAARQQPARPAAGSMLTNSDPRMRIIVGNALQFGRRESLRMERVDLTAWSKEFVTEFWQTEEIDADTLRLSVPREVVPVRADPAQLQKLVWTLCSDLLKYGRASNATDPVEIRVGRSAKTQRRYLDVIDRGTAIGPADSKRVFEPFLAAGKAGTGVSMFVSRELSPGVRSGANNDPRPGGGVVFRLVFADAPAPKKPAEPVDEE